MKHRTIQVFLSILLMLVPTTKSIRVAVLGSGVSGATVARSLADRGMKVTVFEAGHGIGGRTSTRITRDDKKYQFDHGGQYISKPKTVVFQNALDQWKQDGWVKHWTGNFGTATGTTKSDDPVSLADIEVVASEKKERWVGYPGMHSICRNLLHHENIQVTLHSRADAIYKNEDGKTPKWDLVHGKNKSLLGTFDWLVVTDRNSAAHFRKDLLNANVDEFRKGAVRRIQSIKSLTAMVVFEKPLEFDMDGIEFDAKHTNGAFGSLGWAARDTSKPGRDREDGAECWVLQSHPDAARETLKGMKNNIGEIREKAKDVLLKDFIKSIPILAGKKEMDLPPIVHAVGHRWGAAFPLPCQAYIENESQLIAEKHFVACGDYFGTLSGRIEGAYLSGLSAADQICQNSHN